MDEHSAVCPYNGILFGHKKDWSSDPRYNMMNLESTTLSERSQSHETACHVIPFT